MAGALAQHGIEPEGEETRDERQENDVNHYASDPELDP